MLLARLLADAVSRLENRYANSIIAVLFFVVSGNGGFHRVKNLLPSKGIENGNYP
jgi:hypothetical protein